MGLFSRKKKIEVPVPPSEDMLKFPKPSQVEKEILPEKIQEAVGVEEKQELPELPEVPTKVSEPELPETSSKFPWGKKKEVPKPEEELPAPEEGEELGLPKPAPPVFPERRAPHLQKPCFLRVQHYQKLQGDLDTIRINSNELDKVTEYLEKSEFNEGKHYERLKNDLKRIHDRLLFMDDLIFKK